MQTIQKVLDYLQPNNNIIGIDGNLEVYEGYDGILDEAKLTIPEWSYNYEALTPQEKHLLADEMIKRWSLYKSKIK